MQVRELAEHIAECLIERFGDDPQRLRTVLDALEAPAPPAPAALGASPGGDGRRRDRVAKLGRELEALRRCVRVDHVALAALSEVTQLHGLATSEELGALRAGALRALAESPDGPALGVTVTRRVKPPGPDPGCTERKGICQAICCGLSFSLCPDEVRSGAVAFDEGQPFRIGRATDGFCVHLHRSTRTCGVYGERPRVCQAYSCARDRRIWADYENRELTGWAIQRLATLAGNREE